MADFNVGDRVQAKRNGYGFKVRRFYLGTDVGTTRNAVYIEMDNPRGRPRELGSAAHYALDFGHARDLFKVVVVVTAAEEAMVPMSRVREVATRYAQANGWCGEVDRALAEIETPKPDLVEVTYTLTHTFQVPRDKVGELREARHVSNFGPSASYLSEHFVRGTDSVKWTRSEITESEPNPDAGWTSFGGFRRPGGIPAEGLRVRVRPGVVAVSMGGARFPSGRVGRVVHDNTLLEGQVAVRFEDDTNRGTRYMQAEDLQVHAG